MASDAPERAWRGLLTAHARLVPEFDRVLQRETGLPLAWYDVLVALHEGGPSRMSELGERVLLSRSRVSRIVDELVDAGLVAREANPEDGRSSLATLTPEGRRRFLKGARVYLRSIDGALTEALDPDDLDRLADLLGRLAEPRK
jgi:DNA-binding MarR family transcriptional regulator